MHSGRDISPLLPNSAQIQTRWSSLRRLRPTRAILPTTLGLMGAIAVWWLITASGAASAQFLPSPSLVIHTAIRMLEGKGGYSLFANAKASTLRVLIGFLGGTGVGIVLGVGIHELRIVRYFFDPVLAFLRPIPPLAFLTVLIVWFGIGELPKVLLIMVGVTPPITVYTALAMAALPDELADAALCLGLTTRQLLLRVRVPAALPDVFAGMRVMLALAWTSVMGAELVSANSGLGWMIWQGSRNLQANVVFVGVLCIAAIGGLMDGALMLLARVTTGGWRSRLRSE